LFSFIRKEDFFRINSVPSDTFTQTPIHGQYVDLKFQSNRRRDQLQIKKNFHVGYEYLLEENNVREMINHIISFKKYLTW